MCRVVLAGFIVMALALSGCMRITVTAREGSTVNVDQRKVVTTTTDANIPQSALGM